METEFLSSKRTVFQHHGQGQKRAETRKTLVRAKLRLPGYLVWRPLGWTVIAPNPNDSVCFLLVSVSSPKVVSTSVMAPLVYTEVPGPTYAAVKTSPFHIALQNNAIPCLPQCTCGRKGCEWFISEATEIIQRLVCWRNKGSQCHLKRFLFFSFEVFPRYLHITTLH